MKLLRLRFGVNFRSLAAGFEVDFLREWDRDHFDEFHPYCLAGRNGSGKSNILEALAAIFYHIECIYLNYRPVGFEEKEYKLQILRLVSAEELPTEAYSLVVIAKVGSLFRIRVFDEEGQIVSDKNEMQLHQKGLDSLKNELGEDALPSVEDLGKKKSKQILRKALWCSGVAVPNGFSPDETMPDAFELEYLIPDNVAKRKGLIAMYKGHLVAHIRISKKEGERPVVRYSAGFPDSKDAGEELVGQEVKSYLPKYVIGYSSGHNEILSLPFFKMRFIHFDEYRDKLAKGDFYGKPEGRMIYVDDQFSQAILICHFLFPSEAVTKIFEDKIGIRGIRRFRIIIRRDHRVPIAAERVQSMSTEDRKDEFKTTVELTSKLTGYEDRQGLKENEKSIQRLGLIDALIKCSTAHHEDYSAYADGEGSDLYLDYWVNEATKRAFRVHFGDASGESEELDKAKSALNLFQAFQTLLTLNYYKVDDQTKLELYHSGSLYVNETIPIPASHERITRFKEGELIKKDVSDELYVKSLSDGEQQLLHTVGLCLLYRHESALFLLDEPETHLNPDWRASYISILRDALEIVDSKDKTESNIRDRKPTVMREVLLTSHSPFIISDCHQENVLVFEKYKDGQVTHHRPDFNTFGASANLITMEIFKRDETIGDHSNKKLGEMVDKINEPDADAGLLVREINREFGESVERTMALGRVLQASEPTKE